MDLKSLSPCCRRPQLRLEDTIGGFRLYCNRCFTSVETGDRDLHTREVWKAEDIHQRLRTSWEERITRELEQRTLAEQVCGKSGDNNYYSSGEIMAIAVGIALVAGLGLALLMARSFG